MSKRSLVLYISFFLLFFSCCIISFFGFNLGLELTGSIVVELTSEKQIENINVLRNCLKQSGFYNVKIQNLNNTKDLTIQLPSVYYDNDFTKKIEIDLINILKKNINQKFLIKKISWFGPNISNNLLETAIVALLIALISILIYIGLRFEWRLAIGAVVSLVYDLIIIFGVLSITSIEINFVVIASLMSVIGYSINDKIVIFDRIRENFSNTSLKLSSYEIFNISLTQVLNRTIITSITTVFVLLVLLIFGGSMLYGFSITLLLGVIIGTISSIYIASTLAFKLGVKKTTFY